MMKKFYLLFCLCFFAVPIAYAQLYKDISYINEISDELKNADQDTLVIFDVDNVISAPSDLIGRLKARAIRREIFKEYEEKYGKDAIERIHALYMMHANDQL